MTTPLPPWFKQAWVLVLVSKHGKKRRYVTYWGRAKYEDRITWWKGKGAKVLYGIHVARK